MAHMEYIWEYRDENLRFVYSSSITKELGAPSGTKQISWMTTCKQNKIRFVSHTTHINQYKENQELEFRPKLMKYTK